MVLYRKMVQATAFKIYVCGGTVIHEKLGIFGDSTVFVFTITTCAM